KKYEKQPEVAKYLSMLTNQEYKYLPQDVIRWEDIAYFKQRERIINALNNLLSPEEKNKINNLNNLYSLVAYRDFWQKAIADNEQVFKIIFCEKIAHRIDQRLTVIKDVELIRKLKNLQEDLKQRDKNMEPIFWKKYLANEKLINEAKSTLKAAEINEISILITQLSFKNGNLQILNHNDLTGFLEGAEGPRMIINFAEWAKISGQEELKNICNFIASISEDKDFEIKKGEDLSSVRQVAETLFNNKNLARLFMGRYKALALFSRMAAAGASEDPQLIEKYKDKLEAWLKNHPKFLKEKMNYFEISMYYFALPILYPEIINNVEYPVNYDVLLVDKAEKYEDDDVDISSQFKILETAWLKLALGDFQRNVSQVVQEQKMWGQTASVEDYNNAGVNETSGGKNINLGLTAHIFSTGLQMYKIHKDYYENERAVDNFIKAMEQAGIKKAAKLDVLQSLKYGEYEIKFFKNCLLDIIEREAKQADQINKFRVILKERMLDMQANTINKLYPKTRKLEEEYIKPLEKIMQEEGGDYPAILERYEEFLRSKLTSEDNIPLRLALVDTMLNEGERYVEEAEAEVLDLFRVYRTNYKAVPASEFSSADEITYQGNVFIRILERYTTIAYENFPEINTNKNIDSSLLLIKNLFSFDENIKADFDKIIPKNTNLVSVLTQEQALITNAAPETLSSVYLRYRVYEMTTRLLEKKMNKSQDFATYWPLVWKYNALTIVTLNQVNKKYGGGLRYLLTCDKIEDFSRLEEIANNALSRIVYLAMAKGDQLYAQLSPAELFNKKVATNCVARQKAFNYYLQAHELMRIVLN
ncbi:MAG: hypothetical protein KKA19_06340, partial [Candidatus Margulisbacteria bacterium]|nr:hypothetical protein [Candidatus Margulisiibacteriota bacterium]